MHPCNNQRETGLSQEVSNRSIQSKSQCVMINSKSNTKVSREGAQGMRRRSTRVSLGILSLVGDGWSDPKVMSQCPVTKAWRTKGPKESGYLWARALHVFVVAQNRCKFARKIWLLARLKAGAIYSSVYLFESTIPSFALLTLHNVLARSLIRFRAEWKGKSHAPFFYSFKFSAHRVHGFSASWPNERRSQ